MTFEERKAQVRYYLGRTVRIEIDRPIGAPHPKHPEIIYPINYGYIPEVFGGDGEELDVYVLGLDEPVAECTVRVIAIVHRSDDVEDKLVATARERSYSKEEIERAVYFQEQFHESEIEILK
ncbi:MAG: inorganic diphosphatase [Clostridia bacterium]|nr:inorganic diphosphatase [Clostridia bacterium]